MRPHTNANLNKASNASVRAVFFNRLGEFQDLTFENQWHQVSGLHLVSAAIILWNAVKDELLSHAAPQGCEHSSLTSEYLWSGIESPEDGYRPLRMQNSRSGA